MILEGRVHLFGHNVDTDAIIPARYLSAVTAEELAPFCMTDIRPGFADAVQQGDIIVAGKNFRCGSSREHAPLAIKGTGIACVVAHSFARIFYRNAINIGLPILECGEDLTGIMVPEERIRVDLERGEILQLSSGRRFYGAPFPEFMQEIIRSGGLIEYVRRRLEEAPSQE